MKIIYVRNTPFPEDFVDGEETNGVVFTRSFYTATDIVSDGRPAIVIADEDVVSNHPSSEFAAVLKKYNPDILFFLVSYRMSNDQHVDGTIGMSRGKSLAGQLISMLRAHELMDAARALMDVARASVDENLANLKL